MFKNGVNLNKNGWYCKFLEFLWGGNIAKEYKNFCPLFWLIIGSIVISPIVLIIKGLIRFGNIKIGYMPNKDTAITIGKSVFWIMRFVFSLVVTISISIFLYLVVVIISDAIAQGEIYMILAVIGVSVIATAIIYGFINYLIHYDVKMEKVGYHYKDIKTTKDKIMAIPFMILRIIFVKIFGGFFKLIGGAIYHIYKKCCPIINWN